MNSVAFQSRGLTLRGFVHEPKQYDTAIIYLHGFPGHATGKTGRRLVPALARNGYLVLCFDFHGTDLSDGDFAEKLISNEVRDIRAAINFLAKHYTYKRLVLVGHSTGAINAALYAHKDKRVHKIVLVGGSGELQRAVQYEFTPVQVRQFWEQGYMKYHAPGDWYHKKRLKKQYYDEFFTLNMLGALRKYTGKTLVVHAAQDEVIQDIDAQELSTAAKHATLKRIPGAGHQFRTSRHMQQLVRCIHQFIHS